MSHSTGWGDGEKSRGGVLRRERIKKRMRKEVKGMFSRRKEGRIRV